MSRIAQLLNVEIVISYNLSLLLYIAALHLRQRKTSAVQQCFKQTVTHFEHVGSNE